MNFINKLLSITLLLVLSTVSADPNTKSIKGEAVITVTDKTYTLPLQKCYGATRMVEGKRLTAFIINTHLSRRSKKKGHRLSIIGSRSSDEEKTFYSLRMDGGFQKGGIDYRGEMPFESFNIETNELVFKGEAASISKKDKKPVKSVVPIEFEVRCY